MPDSRILLTPRSITSDPDRWLELVREAGCIPVIGPVGRQPTAEELGDLLEGCVGYVAGTELVTATVLEGATSLRVISRNGSGVESIDLDAASRLGIAVRTAVGANSRSVAELTIGLMICLARDIPTGNSGVKAGDWNRSLGRELRNRTLAVVGLGNIGCEVARMALSLGMTVLGVDPSPRGNPPSDKHFTLVNLDTALSQADVVTLHAHSSQTGQPLIGVVELDQVKGDALIINTARAGLVDRLAMLSALDDGRVRGYAVDAFESEPPDIGALEGHPNVILTPHIGAFTDEAVAAASRMAIENALEVVATS